MDANEARRDFYKNANYAEKPLGDAAYYANLAKQVKPKKDLTSK